MVWCGLAWFGMIWRDLAWFGVVWHGLAWFEWFGVNAARHAICSDARATLPFVAFSRNVKARLGERECIFFTIFKAIPASSRTELSTALGRRNIFFVPQAVVATRVRATWQVLAFSPV